MNITQGEIDLFFINLFKNNNKVEFDKKELFCLLRDEFNFRFKRENITQLNKKIGCYCRIEYNKHKKKYLLRKLLTIDYFEIKKKYIEEAKMKDSKIKTYLIKDRRSGLYKIGKSVNPKVRERTLQSENPELNIIKLWNYNIESILHKEYNHQRRRGEWFELSRIQIRYICTNF